MSVVTRINDKDGCPIDSVSSNGKNGLLVGTFEAEKYFHFESDFVSKASGNEMAVNGLSTGGAELNIWDGTGLSDIGAPDWVLSGVQWNESAASAQSGTNGFDTGVTEGKSFLDGGIQISLVPYTSLTFWVNTQFRDVGTDIRIRWEDSGGNNIGTRLNLSSYITWAIGVWTKVTIPLSDFAVTGNVQRLEIDIKNGLQHHYFDGFKLTTAAGLALGPQVYKVCAPIGFRHLVRKIRLTLVGDSNAAWNHDTFANISKLQNGLILRVIDSSDYYNIKELYVENIQDNIDLFGRFKSEDIITFLSNGRMITFFMEFKDPIVLDSRFNMEFIVRDDLSGLFRLQARAFGGSRLADQTEGSEPDFGRKFA